MGAGARPSRLEGRRICLQGEDCGEFGDWVWRLGLDKEPM